MSAKMEVGAVMELNVSEKISVGLGCVLRIFDFLRVWDKWLIINGLCG